jgi:hypothetical protein
VVRDEATRQVQGKARATVVKKSEDEIAVRILVAYQK